MWRFYRKRRRRKPTKASTNHYTAHKEQARALVHEKLALWNDHYCLEFKKVAIRNSRSRWGSCSINKNLNFNYKILFLPPELQDYLIVHELCHLREFNHQEAFWMLVAQTIPDYKCKVKKLREVEKVLSTYP